MGSPTDPGAVRVSGLAGPVLAAVNGLYTRVEGDEGNQVVFREARGAHGVSCPRGELVAVGGRYRLRLCLCSGGERLRGSMRCLGRAVADQ